jgi:quercetin 2,3-dioxygenase
MIRKIDAKAMSHSDSNGHHILHHFSFNDYIHPENMSFGVLKWVDDAEIDPHKGFGMHPHKNMEIITYIIDGEISHMDSSEKVES